MNRVIAILEYPDTLATPALHELLGSHGVTATFNPPAPPTNIGVEIDTRLEKLASGIIAGVVARIAPLLSPESLIAAIAPIMPRQQGPPLHMQGPPPQHMQGPPPQHMQGPPQHMQGPQPPPTSPAPPAVPPQIATLLAMLGQGQGQQQFMLTNSGKVGAPNIFGWDSHGNVWSPEWGPAPVPNPAYYR